MAQSLKGCNENLNATKFILFILQLAGISGPVFIDENGDRSLSLQMKNFYNGKLFHMASYFRRTEKLEILNVTTYWPGGSVVAPLGRPECGFNGEFCPPPGRRNII